MFFTGSEAERRKATNDRTGGITPGIDGGDG
jgi:hypothetical protein